MNPQPPAAPITPEEIAALRDALAKATPGEWYADESYITTGGRALRDNVLAEFREAFPFRNSREDNAAFSALARNLMPKLLAALDAAEAQAVEFAWDALAFASVDPAAIATNTDYSVYQCLTTASVKAAEYLAARGLLRSIGGWKWQRVEGGK